MTVNRGIVWTSRPNTIVITTTSDDKMEFCSHELEKCRFDKTCKNRNNVIVIIASDSVPGMKLMMRFKKERLYIQVKDDLFGQIISEAYTYE